MKTLSILLLSALAASSGILFHKFDPNHKDEQKTPPPSGSNEVNNSPPATTATGQTASITVGEGAHNPVPPVTHDANGGGGITGGGGGGGFSSTHTVIHTVHTV